MGKAARNKKNRAEKRWEHQMRREEFRRWESPNRWSPFPLEEISFDLGEIGELAGDTDEKLARVVDLLNEPLVRSVKTLTGEFISELIERRIEEDTLCLCVAATVVFIETYRNVVYKALCDQHKTSPTEPVSPPRAREIIFAVRAASLGDLSRLDVTCANCGNPECASAGLKSFGELGAGFPELDLDTAFSVGAIYAHWEAALRGYVVDITSKPVGDHRAVA